MVSATEESMAGEKPDLEKVKAFFRDKWKEAVVCPICRSTEWRYYGDVVAAPLWGSPSLGQTFPLVAVVCATCSHVLFFSAVLTGALPPDPPKSQSGGSQNG